jgi:glutathione S-transferase
MVTLNELLPAIAKLIIHDPQSPDSAYANLRAINALNFLENLLSDRTFFAGEQLTFADIVAGTLICRLPDLGVPLTDYPQLKAWSDRLLSRPSWQQIRLSPEEWSSFKRHLKVMPKIWERRRRQRVKALC